MEKICTFARVMRLSEKIVSAVLVLLAVVLAVLCVRSIYFTQQAADSQNSPLTSHPSLLENGRD
ncbi:MAG: hypothetical protein J5797_09875 [Prevotella sp.]|nr:hypothetical protein [Prevotella sp.]